MDAIARVLRATTCLQAVQYSFRAAVHCTVIRRWASGRAPIHAFVLAASLTFSPPAILISPPRLCIGHAFHVLPRLPLASALPALHLRRRDCNRLLPASATSITPNVSQNTT